jgi:hypothetical protein
MAATPAHHVRQLAAGRCEICRLPQKATSLPFEIDHIIARKHGGRTAATNLALACWYCNSFKGSDISGIDPKTGKLTALYNPRRHNWARHFAWREDAYLIGRTPIGRVTIVVLRINDPFRIELRETLIEEGVFPPG